MNRYFSKQAIFLILTVIMVIAVGGLVIYASYFMIVRLNAALASSPEQQAVPKFDTEGFKKLNLIK